MKRLAASLIVLAATSSAYALDFASEMYVVGSLGRLKIHQTSNTAMVNVGANTTASGVFYNILPPQSSQETSHNGYKLQLGYEFSPHFAVEGGYVDLGKTTNTSTYATSIPGVILSGVPLFPSPGPNGNVTTTRRISGWSVAGVGFYPVNDAFSLFAKLGVIDAKVTSSSSSREIFSTMATTSETSESNWKGYYGIGAIFYPDHDRDLGIRLEYERFNDFGDVHSTGSTDVNLMSLGVSSRF